MHIIEHSGHILARHILPEDMNEPLNFFSSNNDFIQAGIWQYDAGKTLQAHVHKQVERVINRTCEVLYIISGSLQATIYTLDHEIVDVFLVHAGEILILLECGHGYKILQDNTQVLEVKNGPYLGAEVDRYRIDVLEGDV